MQLPIKSVNESLVGPFGEGYPLGAERRSGADIPDRPADSSVCARLDSFDVV